MSAVESLGLVERRIFRSEQATEGNERRQFAESRDSLALEVRELADAIDTFKLAHHRRYVTLGEVLEVVKGLGYHR